MGKSVWHLHVKVYANVLASHVEVCCVALRRVMTLTAARMIGFTFARARPHVTTRAI